jgi:hypothetical protein
MAVLHLGEIQEMAVAVVVEMSTVLEAVAVAQAVITAHGGRALVAVAVAE